MNKGMLSLAAAVAAWTGAARADVKVQEKTRVKFSGAIGFVMNTFGGSAAGDGQVRTVAVRGDRKLSLDDASGELVDLKEEKVYRLDAKKRTYDVETFEQLRNKMKQASSAVGGDDKPSSTQPSAGPREDDTEVDVDVKRTGQKKTINGFDAEEVVVTITARKKGMTLEQGGGTVITQDAWLAPGLEARNDLAEFDRRYFEKLYGKTSAAAMRDLAVLAATNPSLGPGMERLQKEAGKLKGQPVLTTLTVETVKKPAPPAQAEEEAPPTSTGGIGGFLAKAVAKKIVPKDEPRSTLLTSSNELLSISRAVSDADVALPAGYTAK